MSSLQMNMKTGSSHWNISSFTQKWNSSQVRPRLSNLTGGSVPTHWLGVRTYGHTTYLALVVGTRRTSPLSVTLFSCLSSISFHYHHTSFLRSQLALLLLAAFYTPQIMSSAFKRLSSLAAHFTPASSSPTVADNSVTQDVFKHTFHTHQLSPTFFLPRAASIEPDV